MGNIRREIYTGLALLIFGAALYLFIPNLIQGSKGLGEVGPDFFPRILAILIIVLSLTQIVKSFLSKLLDNDGEEEKVELGYTESEDVKRSLGASVFVFIIMLLYVYVLVEFLSFIFSTIIAMSIIMWALSVRKWYFYLILMTFVFIIDFIFRNLLYVQLP